MNRHLVKLGGAVAVAVLGRSLIRRRRRIDWRGRSAVITGGSRGLGLVLARQLVDDGAQVAILARSAVDLAEARHQLGEDAIAIACDVRDRAQLEAALQIVLDRRGRIDLLVNNAGAIQVGPLDHMTAADFEDSLAVHFWAPLHAMLAVIPAMRAQGGGRIVNISSFGGQLAVPHMAPYCAGKFALTGLSDAIRAEVARDRIHVTTVCPGLMRTGSSRNVAVRGRHGAEAGWFMLGAGAPLISMDAERAARKILRAARHGQPFLRLGVLRALSVVAGGLAPNLVAEAMAVIDRLLPRPTGPAGDVSRQSAEVRPRWLPGIVTRMADRAAERNNEHGAPGAVQAQRAPASG